MTDPAVGKTLGQIAFEAHRDYLEGNRPWSDVRQPEREVWEAAAKAVDEAVMSGGWPGRGWAYSGRDRDGNMILKYAESGGLYHVIPEEDLP
jgi:hypothetical protein